MVAGMWLLVVNVMAAADPVSFQTNREHAMDATVEAFCGRVEALKQRFSELAAFGNPLCMQRGTCWVFFDASKAPNAPKSDKPVGIFMRMALVDAAQLPVAVDQAFPRKLIGAGEELDVGGTPEMTEAVTDAYLEVCRKVLEPRVASAVLARAGLPDGMDERLAAAESAAGGGRWIDEVIPEIPYQRGFRSTVAGRVFVALRGAVISPERQERIFGGLRDRRYPPDAWREVVAILREQGPALWPERSQEIARMLVAVENEGSEGFNSTPFFGAGWQSVARSLREDLAQEAGRSPDTRFLPMARFLVENDPVASIRVQAVSCVNQMDAPSACTLAVDALSDGCRGVVVVAADFLAKHTRPEATGVLRELAQSSVIRVREAAGKALRSAGVEVPVASVPFALPAEAVKIIETLRKLGLGDARILDVLSRPETVHVEKTEPGKAPVVQRLEDKWRIASLDAGSVRKRAAQYQEGFGLDFGSCLIDPTGPFLLAASAPTDTETQRLIYESMGEEFENDAAALQRGVDYLAWSIFLQGVDGFQQVNDVKAAAVFRRMEVFAPYAKPSSSLSVWLGQGRTLLAEIERRQAKAGSVEPTDGAGRIAYWVARIPEINGFQMSQPGAPSIWQERNPPLDGMYKPNLPFASDELRRIGRAAIPLLVEMVDDATPTRTIGYWRDYDSSRYWITAGQAAEQIIRKICDDEKLESPFKEPYEGNPAKIGDVWGHWLAKLQATGAILGRDTVDLSQCYGPYRIKPFVKVAATLQALPEKARVAQLRAWAAVRDRGEWDRPLGRTVILLCRMLFEKKGGGSLPKPGFGAPSFIGGAGWMRDAREADAWPDEPFYFVGNIPIDITSGYILAGAAEQPDRYLENCLRDGRWTARRYAEVTDKMVKQAVQTLLRDHTWLRPLRPEEVQLITAQALPYEAPKLWSGIRGITSHEATVVVMSRDDSGKRKLPRLDGVKKLQVTVNGGCRPYKYAVHLQSGGRDTVIGSGHGGITPINPFDWEDFFVPWRGEENGDIIAFELVDARGARLVQRMKVTGPESLEMETPAVTDAAQ